MFSFKTWAGIVFAFIVACVMVVASIRQVGPSPEQAAALDLLHTAMPPVEGRDGSDAAWLLGYDVDVSDRAKRAAELRDYLARKFGPHSDPAEPIDPRKKWVAFPEGPAAGNGVCDDFKPACIEYVRKNQAKSEATLKANARALAASLELQRFDGLRYGLLPSRQQEMPEVATGRRLVMTHLAWLFASGQQAEAVAQTCRDIAAWRRLGGNTDVLVANIAGVDYVQQSLGLLAEMLAEVAPDQALPASCAAALAPAAEFERSICPSIALEYVGLTTNYYEDLRVNSKLSATKKFLRRYVMDKENADAMSAVSTAQYCSDEARRELQNDTPTADWFRTYESCPWLREIADPIGCTRAMSAFGRTYIKYQDRRMDQVQMLGLMNTLLWLRKSGAAQSAWSALLQSRPASLGLDRTPRIEAGMLVIPMWDQTHDKEFSLPTQVPSAI